MTIRDSLQDRLDEDTAGALPERLELALQMARILRAWHRMGKYHGRLSAETVFVNGCGRVVLAAAEPWPETASEAGDVRAFGLILQTLLDGLKDVPEALAALCSEALDGSSSMKQVVAVLERESGGGRGHAAWHWLIRMAGL